MSFIGYAESELFSIDESRQFRSENVTHDVDASRLFEFFCWFHKDLNLVAPQMFHPGKQLISPRVFQRTWGYYQNGPVSLEEVSYWNGLNSFAHSHFVSQNDPSEVVNAILNSYFLEIVQRVIKRGRQQWKHRSVHDVMPVIIVYNVFLCLVGERHRVFQEIKSHLGYRV